MEKLDRSDIQTLLRDLGERLDERGVVADIYIAGGAAVTLCYERDYSTTDVDALYDPRQVVSEVARDVAEESGYEVPDHWLNDALKRYMQTPESDDERREIMADCPGLRVMVASPERILGMKCAAGRQKDIDGIIHLCEHLGIENVDELLDIAERHAVFEGHMARSTERTRAFIEGIFDEEAEMVNQ